MKALHRYATFKDLLENIHLKKCGNDISETPETAAADMLQLFTYDQIQKYGVLGIGMEITDTEYVLKELEVQKEAEFGRLFPDGMK